MNILVAGGSGLIGHHTVCALIARGHAVTVLARRRPDVLAAGADFRAGDLGGGPVDLRGFDGVVQAAGADPRAFPRGSAEAYFRSVNIDASLQLFQAAIEAGARRAVFVTSYYHAVDPALADIHPYVRSRRDSEVAGLAACQGKMALVIVQPPVIVGAIDRPHIGRFLASWARSPAPLIVPPGGTNVQTARGLGEAIAAALERGRDGARYLVGDANVTWSDLLERFAVAVGRPRRARAVPLGLFAGAVVIGHAVQRLRGRDSGLQPWAWSRDVWGRQFFYDSSAARAELGYPIGDLDEAIREICQQPRSNVHWR